MGGIIMELKDIIDREQSVLFQCVMKRTKNKEGIRDFYPRYIWSYSTNGECTDCVWEGFETANECIDDLLKTYKLYNDTMDNKT